MGSCPQAFSPGGLPRLRESAGLLFQPPSLETLLGVKSLGIASLVAPTPKIEIIYRLRKYLMQGHIKIMRKEIWVGRVGAQGFQHAHCEPQCLGPLDWGFRVCKRCTGFTSLGFRV